MPSLMQNRSWAFSRLPLFNNLWKTYHHAQTEDWYSVNISDLLELGFPSHFTKSKLVQLLSEKYPGYHWEKAYLLRGRFAQQKRLERAVDTLFAVCVFDAIKAHPPTHARRERK